MERDKGMKEKTKALHEIVLLYNTTYERMIADQCLSALEYNRYKTKTEVFKLENGLEYIDITIATE